MESNNCKNSSKEKPSPKEFIDKYLNPAVFIAVITYFCYYIGYSYTSAYFGRLGIYFKSIDLPTSYYIMESLMGILIVLFIIYFSLIHKRNYIRNPILRSIKEYSILLIIASLIIYQAISEHNYFILALGILMILLFIVSVYEKRYFAWESMGLFGKSMLIISLISFMTFISSFSGRNHAKLTLEGSNANTTFIKIKTKVYIPDLDNNNYLILLLHNDKKYYLTEQHKPAPLNPSIYIIPDDQIEYAILTKYSE